MMILVELMPANQLNVSANLGMFISSADIYIKIFKASDGASLNPQH